MLDHKALRTPTDRNDVYVSSIAQQGKNVFLLDEWNNRVKCVEVSDGDGSQVRIGELRAFEFESCIGDQVVNGLCTLDERTLIVVVRNVAVAHIDTVSRELRHAGRFANERDSLIYDRRTAFPLLVNARRLVVAFEYENKLFELRRSNGCARWVHRRTLTLPKDTTLRAHAIRRPKSPLRHRV